ncbi:hypothetical protein KO516_17020 [Citreicella sp. C3M06]|uniref:hypothetical protein n=1 Tax=Citreicella sp. C3M06 TaxID=2841564 RepID=UPI001C08FC38|nr:hypothetical protein [Citreicella sp. C3M06]MBU2962493.1 hypothetical protein [Citreicella sp. C3M06]
MARVRITVCIPPDRRWLLDTHGRLDARENGFTPHATRPVHSYGAALIEQCWDRVLFLRNSDLQSI